MRKYYAKATAFLLAFVLIFGLVPVPVSASDAIVPDVGFSWHKEICHESSDEIFEFYFVVFIFCLECFEDEDDYPRVRCYNPWHLIGTQPDPFWGIHNMQWGDSVVMRNGRPVPNHLAIVQSSNLFLYCWHNPVRFIDPTGLELRISGSESFVDTVMHYLRMLTDHTLEMDGNKVIISAFATEITRPLGNELLERVINSTNVTTIQTGGGAGNFITNWQHNRNYFNGVGADNLRINLRPNSISQTYTLNPLTGFFEMMEMPFHITVAHELIHADRMMRGDAINVRRTSNNRILTGQATRYIFSPSFISWTSNVYRTENRPREEFAAIGIRYHRQGDITENQIRQEHGLPIRGGHTGRRAVR